MIDSFNALGLSHKWIRENVQEGDFCIDATAGRGRDTLFLATAVGKSGTVLAFDVQKAAVDSTLSLLSENKIINAQVIHGCHSTMDQYAKECTVSAIMFNFGWLPGGDHRLFSKKDTSLIAIEKGLRLLKPGGIMTLCLYYGKETGTEERDAVLDYLKALDQKKYSVLLQHFLNRKNDPPMCAVIIKEAQ